LGWCVRWLLDRGAALDEPDAHGCTALYLASCEDHTPVVALLLDGGADPTLASGSRMTPLAIASHYGCTETVRCLLAHPSAAITINRRENLRGRTALWWACQGGHGGVVRLLLEHGADPTIANNHGATPMAAARNPLPWDRSTAEGRRECVAALEVRCPLRALASARADHSECCGACSYWRGGQEAERAYLLFKARQVADAASSFAADPVMEARTRGEAKRQRVEAVPQELRGRAAAGGGERLPGVTVVAASEGEEGNKRAALLDWAVHSLKPGVFEELMEMMK
jgi:hypothetical protein